MNIIDRSPLKMTTQEALYSQSSRRMKEAKTDEEKVSIVQNFAEQLRLEKLRAKRFQQNLQELSNTIANSSPAVAQRPATERPFGTSVQPPSLAAATGAFPVTQSTSNRKGSTSGNCSAPIQQKEKESCTATWLNPYAAHNDLFDNVTDDVKTISKNLTNMMTKSSTDGESRTVDGLMYLDINAKHASAIGTPSSRPLNANAPPFMMQSKSAGSNSPSPASNPANTVEPMSLRGMLVQRISSSPPITRPAIAVAPKVAPVIDLRSSSRPGSNVRPGSGVRPRSSSIGAHQNAAIEQHISDFSSSAYKRSPINSDCTANVTYHQQKELVSPTFETGACGQNLKNDGSRKSPFQADGGSNIKRSMGTVKIETGVPASGVSLLRNEDWDMEYAQAEQERDKQDEQRRIRQMEKRNGRPLLDSDKKDWLSILKERDDMAKRRYSRQKMVELYHTEASCIRPAHLSPEYNTAAGLWSPDLWFHVNFQTGNAQHGGFNACNGASVNVADRSRDFQRIHCLSEFAKKKAEERRSSR